MRKLKTEFVADLLFAKTCRPEFRGPGLLALALGLTLFSPGCLHHSRQSTTVIPPRGAPPTFPPTNGPGARQAPGPLRVIQGEEGIASWYGHPYHGRRAASGEIYNMYDLTAAHRTLPFGTKVKVHDLQNGQQVEVRINDRGPFVEGRIIDLSYAAAQAIRLDVDGVAPVRLEILGYGAQEGPTPLPGIFAVQVGAFKDEQNAERLKARISTRFAPVVIQSFDRGDGMFHRVRVGAESAEEAAQELARHLRETNLATETFVVRMN